MVVETTGTVRPCCFAPGFLGKITPEVSAEQIWNGDRAVELRKYVRAARLHPICSGAICKYVQGARSEDSESIRDDGRDTSPNSDVSEEKSEVRIEEAQLKQAMDDIVSFLGNQMKVPLERVQQISSNLIADIEYSLLRKVDDGFDVRQCLVDSINRNKSISCDLGFLENNVVYLMNVLSEFKIGSSQDS